MNKTALLTACLTLWLHIGAMAGSVPDKEKPADSSTALTLDNLGRGIKSAAKNISEEIPKIGPAVGETFKKITGKSTDQNQSSKHSGKEHPHKEATPK